MQTFYRPEILIGELIPVLHVITRLIVGGAQENTLYTAELLDSSRYKVEVLTGLQTGSEGNLFDDAIERGINISLLPEMVRQLSPILDLTAFRKLSYRISQNHYKIVHTHSSKAGVIGRLAAYKARSPIIIHTVHGWSFHKFMSPVLRILYISLERICAQISDALVFVSHRDMLIAKKTHIGNPDKYRLIRSAIPLDLFDPTLYDKEAIRKKLGVPNNALIVGYIGRFSAQKDPLSWAKVAINVSKVIPNSWFLLVGDGSLRHLVEDEFIHNGLGNRVIFTGIRRDIPQLFSAMDVFMITSLWEGLPRVIPQAMSMKIPVVANNVPGIDEVIKHGSTGYLASIGDINLLSACVCEMLQKPELRSKMSEEAGKIVNEQFNLLNMINQIASLYEELLEKNINIHKNKLR